MTWLNGGKAGSGFFRFKLGGMKPFRIMMIVAMD
jgi:hypothetical protein